MKTLICLLVLGIGYTATAQSIVGRWQLTEEKTCFQADMKESDTEKELSKDMQSTSQSAVARVMTLGEKGDGEESIVSAGKKKATSRKSFQYKVTETELQFIDKKSGLVTARYVIDELTDDTLRVHDAARDCEIKSYIRAK